jgi:hypothetical protein
MDLHPVAEAVKMGSRKFTRDRIDKFWRRWLSKKGFGWIDYEKTKVSEINVTYAVEIHKVNALMNESYRAGFADGRREAKRDALSERVDE